MQENQPNILLNYIRRGCTGVAQPCDVGMQRLFKLSTKWFYHEGVVSNFLSQIKAKKGALTINHHISTRQNGSVQCLYNAHIAINKPDLVLMVSLMTLYMQKA